jgi:hypothetical protein
MKSVYVALCVSVLTVAPLALAEEFSSTPKHETMAQAIQFEKYKIAAAEAQARKDAAEAARNTPSSAQRKAAASNAAASGKAVRKTGQADSKTRKE